MLKLMVKTGHATNFDTVIHGANTIDGAAHKLKFKMTATFT